MLALLTDIYVYLYSIPIIEILQSNFTMISISLYILWYLRAYLSKTILIAKEGDVMHEITDKMTSIHAGYRPTFWCAPSTLNTLIFGLIQKCIKHKYVREIITTEDGGEIAIDWANLNSTKNKVIVLVLPGLTGSSKDNYVTHFVDEARKSECIAVVMNYRGISIELKTPRTYCATNYEDLHMVVKHIHNKYNGYRIVAVGISLGGIKLGGYLSKHFDDCLISHSMIVSSFLLYY